MNAVATINSSAQTVINGVGVSSTLADLDVFVTWPYIFFVVANRSGHRFEAVSRGNGQNQSVNAVATINSGTQTVIDGVSVSGTLANLDVFVTRPYILFIVANRGGHGFEVIGRGDGQGQLVNAVAAVCRAEAVPNGVGVSGTLADLDVFVTFPNILFIVANRGGLFFVVGRGDGQHQVIDTVAAACGVVVSGDGACL